MPSVTFKLPAPAGARWVGEVAASLVGQPVRPRTGSPSVAGTITAARIVDDGLAMLVDFDLAADADVVALREGLPPFLFGHPLEEVTDGPA